MSDVIKSAIKSGPKPKIRDWRSLPTKELTRAERTMRFCETHLRVPEGAGVGQKLHLYDFQQAFLYSVLDNPAGTRTAIFSVARKNGKSALVACILLSYLVGPEAKQNTQIVSGAMSREQAALVFNLASKMVSMSPELAPLVKVIPSSKRLIGLPMNVEFRALASDGSTAQGLSVYLGLIDEVGQVRGPKSDFVDAITTSQGAHDNPLIIYLSTQAATDADLLSVMIDDAKKSKDPRTVCHLYEANKECALSDEDGWQMANPALGIFRSKDDLSEQMAKAERMPSAENSARNLLLNQRVSTFAPFVSRQVWEANGGDVVPSMDGFKLYAGLDLSAKTDLTSLVIIGVRDGVTHVWPYFWTPEGGLHDRADKDRQPYDVWVREGYLRTTAGNTVSYEAVIKDIVDILGDNRLEVLAFDRWRIDIFKTDCQRLGVEFEMKEHGQGYKDMSPAVDGLEELLLNGSIAHGMHPVLTMCAANAVVIKDPAGNRKLDKQKATGRIDGMVALLMAVGAAQNEINDEAAFADFLANPIGG